ncbi:MAG: uroporphyrinogen-III synthase [Methylomonas sp.]|jgi:uroporphyrinogen-III synthase|uniref:uroporphyrinogen-III synthase n=1 Tax=Methylomonas sp. TaxID=418 RepID=UPI0025FE9B65|nr:uroporphyrinogen-III synthase [Methylomonas sp.]MCK9606627.1 uroporphyrinogen-III synthase [Methylomonas sp.]
MTSGLRGATVLVTRPAAQADALCRLITQADGRALRFPTIEIQPVGIDAGLIEKALAGDWLIFTSCNAVDFALKAFGGKMVESRAVKFAAVGHATAAALQKAGLQVACVPETEFSSEGLLAQQAMQRVAGQHIFIVRGVGGREKLEQTLRGRGAEVAYLEVYRRCRPDINSEELIRSLRNQQLSAITITSGEALQNLLAMLDPAAANLLRKQPLLVVSDRIRQLALELGFEQITVSLQPTDAAILETLTTLLNGENSGRSN